jgi:hypothetical protein
MQRKLKFLLYPGETIKNVIITNMAGKIIQILNNKATKGNGTLYRWDGKNTSGYHVSSGVYVYTRNLTPYYPPPISLREEGGEIEDRMSGSGIRIKYYFYI